MPERKIEDRLREQYFDLLPDIRRVLSHLEAEIRYYTLPVLHRLTPYQQLLFKSRIKDCDSTLRTLRRKQEGGTFDPETPERYSILDLPDLAGIRVLAFPHDKLIEVDQALRETGRFDRWIPDPVPDDSGAKLALKYHGYCDKVSNSIQAEYQIVPMLIGLFWEVEHSAMYKPPPGLKGISDDEPMKQRRMDVVRSLLRFEKEFESYVRGNPKPVI